MSNILPVLILLPLAIGLLVSVWGSKLGAAASKLGIAGLLATLVLAIIAVANIGQLPDVAAANELIRPKLLVKYFTFDFPFRMQGHPVSWDLALGLDGIGGLMVLLTTIVSTCVGLAAMKQITTRLNVYLGLILITQSMLLGVFLAMDVLTFYMFFEAVLLPVLLLIYLWGDPQTSAKAARRFLLFTLAGSIPMVVGLIGMILLATTPEKASFVTLPELSAAIAAIDNSVVVAPAVDGVTSTTNGPLNWILYVLLIGFGIKMAIVPLHSWLPTTYESAHPNSTALIAAVVGKLGIFGIVRLVLPFMPNTMHATVQILFASAGVIAIVYGALCALSQRDPRRLFAYSSISHLGFITVGLMSYREIGIQGAILQMCNHGIIVAAVFLLLAALEARYGRLRVQESYEGLANKTPALACFFVFFLLAGAGLPGLNSFVGEYMTVGGMMQTNVTLACFATLGILFGAWYSLRFLQFMFFGSAAEKSDKQTSKTIVDLSLCEKLSVVPLAGLCVMIGVMPMTTIKLFQNDATGIAVAASKSVTEPSLSRVSQPSEYSQLASNNVSGQ
jgi:NADH-quinone oxidoreductase subunit M